MRLSYVVILSITSLVLDAQTTVNPDISVIGKLEGNWTGDALELHGSSVELAFQGYVNPYARVDVFLHKHMDEEPIEVEEAVLAIERGLPFGLALRTGKLRPNFGKINIQHMHTFPQVILPIPVAQILGAEKWSSAGLEVAWLLPLPWYNNLSVAYLESGISEHSHSHEDVEEVSEEEAGKAMSVRYSMFFDLAMQTHIDVGLNKYQVLAEPQSAITALDIKYKWRPDTYRSLVWQTELFFRGAHTEIVGDLTEEHPQITAIYALLNYQFNKIWNAGAILDYSSNLDGAEYHSTAGFLGFSPAEETTVLRFVFKQAKHGVETPNFEALLQLLWSLGPHKAHQF